MTETFFSPRQLANKLDISEPTLARMRCHGSGPRYKKLGRSVKYRWSDVEQWLAECERQSTSEAA
jgi:predicted DNA-binding transcriptional regulator AlpA